MFFFLLETSTSGRKKDPLCPLELSPAPPAAFDPDPDPDAEGNSKFVRMAEKLINIDEISIDLIDLTDLIDRINPFHRAYEILSKSVTADVLRAIHCTISATKIAMSEEKAVALFARIKAFTAERGHKPGLASVSPMERRMAEALPWIGDAKRKRMGDGA
ncbi:hypothetical protein IB278_04740 [Variovorax sp. VRV01]|uniref:hypothetical protein n=1 Tax=Variovorax sp. VRV01 TaxID=2769259 RepID=UPI00177D1137|nr:hypothetical protein [Variovorax sp. VRV01]MBD9663267.1 hypothetical protein [Variovorax sp. VRV01]